MTNIIQIADNADMIINNYAFTDETDSIQLY